MKNFEFRIIENDQKARVGEVNTTHGSFETPVFMPVGTRAAVKTVTPNEVKKTGAQIILSNTYHLYLRPGSQEIKQVGGLHRFMGWDGPILTDSGGYQVFSLSGGKRGETLVKIKDDGVEFKSYLDGSKHFFTPEKVIDIQYDLGSDIMMPLDFCPSADAAKAEISRAVELTTKWFETAWHHYEKIKGRKGALFAIVQGGGDKDLREKSFNSLSRFDVDGFAIGGVANAGESKKKQAAALNYTLPLLPENKPRYLMGVGLPEDILDAIEKGVDMFDCVEPTRIARHGIAITFKGKINLMNSKYRIDEKPLEDGCDCETCQSFSRAYIRHLLSLDEDLGKRLMTIHNLRFMMRFMENIRSSIKKGRFISYKRQFLTDFLTKP